MIMRQLLDGIPLYQIKLSTVCSVWYQGWWVIPILGIFVSTIKIGKRGSPDSYHGHGVKYKFFRTLNKLVFLILRQWYIKVILLLFILNCSEMQMQILENLPLHHGQLQVTTNRLVVSRCSRHNYQALLRLCGYLDSLDRGTDACGDHRRWTVHVCIFFSYILVIQILKVRRIHNPFKFDRGEIRLSHGTSAHVGE